MSTKLDPRKIRTDLEIQSRITLDEETVKEYVEAMERGDAFPSLRVFFDDVADQYILADGFHRLAAHLKCFPNDPIAVTLEFGTVEDARWASIAANKDHGLKRTNADKRNAVQMALLHPKGASLSNRQIANHVGVAHDTVNRIRQELESTGRIVQSDSRTGLDGRTINTANIGGQQPEVPPACGHCRYYDTKKDYCEGLGKETFAWLQACDDFLAKVEEKPLREIPDADYDHVVPCELPSKKANSATLRQNRKLKDCVNVLLPSDNPQLFAMELREHWKPDYLIACFVALKHLLEDDKEEMIP